MFAAWTPDVAFLIDPEIRDATCPLHLLQGLAWAVVIVGLNEEGFPGCAARSGEVPERKVGAFRSWIFRPPWSRPLGSTIHQPFPSAAEATRPPDPGVRDPLRPLFLGDELLQDSRKGSLGADLLVTSSLVHESDDADFGQAVEQDFRSLCDVHLVGP